MRCILFSLLLVLYAQTVSAQKISYQRFTVEDGLPGLQITALHQTKDGRLWIGSKSGLTVFDGKHFKNYGMGEGMQSAHVLDIEEWGDSIVVLTLNSLEIIAHDKVAGSISLKPYMLSKGQGAKIHDKFWLFDNGLLFSISLLGETLPKHKHYHFGFKSGEITPLAFPNNRVISVFSDTALVMQQFYHDTNNNWAVRSFNYHLKEGRAVEIGSEVYLPYRISDLLYLQNNREDDHWHYSIVALQNNTVKPIIKIGKWGQFSRLAVLKDQRVVRYNDLTSSILFFDLKTKTKKAYEFPKIQAKEIIEDVEGNIWIGAETGLYKIPQRPFIYFDAENNLPESNLWVFQALEEELFVGAFNQGLYKADTTAFPTKFTKVSKPQFPKSWRYNEGFYFGAKKFDGNNLVFAVNNGSLIYKNRQWYLLGDESFQVWRNEPLCAHVDTEKEEIMTVGLFGIDFFDFEGNKKLSVPKEKFFGYNVFDIERIDESRYLVALGKGQAIYDRATDESEQVFLSKTTALQDSTNAGLMTLAKDPRGNIWCGSLIGKQGLFLYQDGTFINVAKHVLDGMVETVEVVNEGRILLASSQKNGLLAIHLDRFYTYLEATDKSTAPNPFYWFDESNGFSHKQEPQQNSLVPNGENRVLITTGEAKAYYFDIDTTIFDVPVPIPYIHQVESFDNDSLVWMSKAGMFHANDTIRLETEERAIRFEPHCITHQLTSQLRYAYRYRNGKGWTPWKTANEDKLLLTGLDASYSQLEVKGFYKFQTPDMQAKSHRFWVYVIPFWYETPAGRTAFVLVVFFVAFGIYTISDRRRKHKDKEKQRIKDWQVKAKRLEEIEVELANVKHQEQELIQLQEEVNQYNEELQAIADQFRNWHYALEQGERPDITTEPLKKFEHMPDYSQLMGIITMVGSLTEKLAKQIEREQLRGEELRKTQIKLNSQEDKSALKRLFHEYHPGVLTRLQNQFPQLTARDVELFMLIRLGKSNHEISESMFLSKSSVTTNRKRLKKKLSLSTQVDLTDWVRGF